MALYWGALMVVGVFSSMTNLEHNLSDKWQDYIGVDSDTATLD